MLKRLRSNFLGNNDFNKEMEDFELFKTGGDLSNSRISAI